MARKLPYVVECKSFSAFFEEIAAFNSDRAAENYASDCATCNPHFEYRVVKKR